MDVKICILKSLPNKATLVALRIACRDYDHAYRAAENTILTNVMVRDLHDKGYKAKDVLQLLWTEENGRLAILHAPRHQLFVHYTQAIRALYELESVVHPRRIVEKKHCLMLMDMHDDTDGDPKWFLAGVLERQRIQLILHEESGKPGFPLIIFVGQKSSDYYFDYSRLLNRRISHR